MFWDFCERGLGADALGRSGVIGDGKGRERRGRRVYMFW